MSKRTAEKYSRLLHVSARKLARIVDDYDRHDIPRETLDELCHRIADVDTTLRKISKTRQ